MANAGEFDIKFTADSSDLRSELQKVAKSLDGVADSTTGATNDLRKGLDTAKQSAEGLAKKVPSVGNAAKPVNDKLKQTGKSAEEASNRLKTMEESAGTASSQMSGLAGALSLISPEAGAAAQALADTAGGLEATARGGTRVFAILGPIAVAVAAAGAAYMQLKGRLEEANAALETQRAKLEVVQDMHRKVKEAVLLAALAQGEMTQAEFDAVSAAQSAADLTRERRQQLIDEQNALNQRRLALEAATEAERQAENVSRRLTATFAHGAESGMGIAMANRAAAVQTDSHAAARKKLAVEMKNNARQLEILDQTEERYAKAIEASKSKIEERAVVAKETAAEEIDRSAERLAAMEQLQAIKEAHDDYDKTAREQLLEAAAEEIETIRNITDQHLESGEVRAQAFIAEHQVKSQLIHDLKRLDMKAEQDRKRKAVETEKRIRAERQQTVQMTMSANADLAANSADMFLQLSSMNAEHDKKTARTLFNVWRGLSYAHIALKTAEGLMTAAALPPPIDAIKSAAVLTGAATSTMIVATAKPPFHTGTGMVRAPDRTNELNARLRDGEAVSTPLGAELIGRDTIEAANAGVPINGGSRPVVFQYEHRAFTRFIRDNIRGVTGGLGEAINTGRTIGQRGV